MCAEIHWVHGTKNARMSQHLLVEVPHTRSYEQSGPCEFCAGGFRVCEYLYLEARKFGLVEAPVHVSIGNHNGLGQPLITP